MAHTIQTQVIEDGARNTIIKTYFKGDGSSGNITNLVLFDASAYKTASTDNSLAVIKYNLNGFDAQLDWQASSANIPMMTLDQDLQEDVSFWEGGRYPGLPNNAASDRKGDILFSTTGFGASTDKGYVWLHVLQRGVDNPR